jgi:hypothetical protein
MRAISPWEVVRSVLGSLDETEGKDGSFNKVNSSAFFV